MANKLCFFILCSLSIVSIAETNICAPYGGQSVSSREFTKASKNGHRIDKEIIYYNGLLYKMIIEKPNNLWNLIIPNSSGTIAFCRFSSSGNDQPPFFLGTF